MQVMIELPDAIAADLRARWGDVPRHILQTVAMEGYRRNELSGDQVMEMLGLQSYHELDTALREAGILYDYTEEDYEKDGETLRRLGV